MAKPDYAAAERKFVEKAVRAYQDQTRIPRGFIGTYTSMRHSTGVSVTFSRHSRCWVVRGRDGNVVSRHDSRPVALAKAKRLAMEAA